MTLKRESSLWLALLHQLPAKPPYLRVKIWRRLQALGAAPLKNAVHVLPFTEDHLSAFRQLLKDIVSDGGEATIIEARMIAGLTDSEVADIFNAARTADYQEIVAAARKLADNGPPSDADIARLNKRLAELHRLDFFEAPGRAEADAAVAVLIRDRQAHPDVRATGSVARPAPDTVKGGTWVTRRSVHVDRIACAWLIRRFVDPQARFRFVDATAYTPKPAEIGFDMAGAAFTHEEDRCSFETILRHFNLSADPGLSAIGEIIHDLDIGDARYGRPETAGVAAVLAGACETSGDDLERIALASEALNQFHAYFCRQAKGRS